MGRFESIVNTRNFPIIKWLMNAVAFLFTLPYMTIKHPVIFPLGIYAALIPFDSVLGLGLVGTVTKWLGILIIVSFGANRLIIAKGRLLRPPRVVWSWALFLVLAGVSTLWAVAPRETLSPLYTIVGLFLIYFLVGTYPFTERDYSHLVKLIIIGGVTATICVLVLYLQGTVLRHSVRASLILGVGRVADPNHLATSLILPLLFSFEWATRPRGAYRIWAVVSVVTIAVVILLTGSRGGAVGAAIALPLFLWRSRHRLRWPSVHFSFLTGFLLMFLVLSFIPISKQLLDRFTMVRILETGGAHRLYIWKVGLEAFLHRPIVGYGYNNFPYAYDIFNYGAYFPHRVAHSIYLQSFVELGVIGGLLLLRIAWQHWRLARNLARRNSFGIPLEASLVGILVSSATLGTLYYKYFWLVFSLILLLANTKRGKQLHAEMD